MAVVLPVPPCAIANVPLTGSALAADPSNVTGELELYAVPRATYKLRAVANFVAVPALPLVSAALSGISLALREFLVPIVPIPKAVLHIEGSTDIFLVPSSFKRKLKELEISESESYTPILIP